MVLDILDYINLLQMKTLYKDVRKYVNCRSKLYGIFLTYESL